MSDEVQILKRTISNLRRKQKQLYKTINKLEMQLKEQNNNKKQRYKNKKR